MWVKVKHQKIGVGSLLSKSITKDSIYNKLIYDTFKVTTAGEDRFKLERFLEDPLTSLEIAELNSVPATFFVTYKELVKNNWFIWID